MVLAENIGGNGAVDDCGVFLRLLHVPQCLHRQTTVQTAIGVEGGSSSHPLLSTHHKTQASSLSARETCHGTDHIRLHRLEFMTKQTHQCLQTNTVTP